MLEAPKASKFLFRIIASLDGNFDVSSVNSNHAFGDYWISGDQAGSEASPGVITRSSFRPVTSTE